MQQVTINEAKINLSQLIQKALSGEEVIIAKDRQPLVQLTALPKVKRERHIGGGKGLIVQMDEDFNKPSDDFKSYS